MREKVAVALGEIKDDSVIEPLVKLLEKEEATRVRAAAVQALQAITGQEFGQDTDRWRAWWQNQKKEE